MALSYFELLPEPILNIISEYGIFPPIIFALSKTIRSKGTEILKKYDYIRYFNDISTQFMFPKNEEEAKYSTEFFTFVFSTKPPNDDQIKKLHKELTHHIKYLNTSYSFYEAVLSFFSLCKCKLAPLNIETILTLLEISNKVAYTVLRLFDLDLGNPRYAHRDWFCEYFLEEYPPLLDLFINAKNNPNPLKHNSQMIEAILLDGNLEAWNVLVKNNVFKDTNCELVLNFITGRSKPEDISFWIKIFPDIATNAEKFQRKGDLLKTMIMCGSELFQYLDSVFFEKDFEEFRDCQILLKDLTLVAIVHYSPKVFYYLLKHNLLNFSDVVNLVKSVIVHDKPAKLVKVIISEPGNNMGFSCNESEILSFAIYYKRFDIVKILLENTDVDPKTSCVLTSIFTMKALLKKENLDQEYKTISTIIDKYSKKRKNENKNKKRNTRRKN